MAHPHEGVLSYFWALAELDESRRVSAAHDLIEHLVKLQEAFGDAEPHPDVRYALERLIKGLASPRAGARQGFALALTALLQKFPRIPTDQVVESLLQHTHPTGSATGQEERDAYFGRAFGFLALIRASRISRKDGSLAAMVRELIALWQKKSFLAELCCSILNSLFAKISEKDFQKVALPLLSDALGAAPDTYTPEQLALLLQLESLFKFNIAEHFSDRGWQEGAVLDANLHLVTPALRESSSTTPNLHCVWDLVLQRLASPENATVEHTNFVGKFWREIIEENLFSLTATPARKYTGFLVFEKVLPLLDVRTLPVVFTDKFMRSFVTSIADPSTKLHAVAKHALDRLVAVAEKDAHVKIALLSQLMGRQGNRRNFDQLTKTKTVDRLMQGWNAADVQSYLAQLEESFYGTEQDEAAAAEKSGKEEESDEENPNKDIEGRRLWVLEQIQALMHNPKLPKEQAIVSEALAFVAVHSFVTVESNTVDASVVKGKNKPKTVDVTKLLRPTHPALSERTREQARQRLYSLLHELLTQHPDKEKMGGLAADGSPWALAVYRLLREASKLESVTFVQPLSEDSESARKRLDEALVWLHRFLDSAEGQVETDRVAHHRARAFQLLLAHLGVLLYAGDDDVPALIEDLVECRARLLEGEAAAAAGDGPAAIVVFVDSLISLMSRPSALFRDLVGHVFRVFTQDVTGEALDLLLKVVQTEGPRDAPEEGGEDENDEEDDDVDEGEDDEGDESENEEEEKEKEEGNGKGKKAGKKAGKRSKMDKQGKLKRKVEESDEDESEDDALPPATDEEMLLADAKLAEMFKHMKSEKSASGDRDREALNFKLRVLDLVETFLRRQPQSPFVLRAVLSLCATATRYHQSKEKRPLFERVAALLTNKIGHQKEYAKDVPREESLRALRSVLARLRRTTATGPLLNPLIAAVHYVIKMFLHAADDETREVLLGDLRKMLVLVLRKRRSLRLDFFAELVRRFPQLAPLCKDMLAGATEGRNLFLRCEAFTLATKVLAQRGVPLSDTLALLGDVREAVVRLALDGDMPKNGGRKLNTALQTLLHLLQYVAKSQEADGAEQPWADTWPQDTVLPALRKLASETSSSAVPGTCGALASLLYSNPELGQELKALRPPKAEKKKKDKSARKEEKRKSKEGGSKSEKKHKKQKSQAPAAAGAGAATAAETSKAEASKREGKKHKHNHEKKEEEEKEQKEDGQKPHHKRAKQQEADAGGAKSQKRATQRDADGAHTKAPKKARQEQPESHASKKEKKHKKDA